MAIEQTYDSHYASGHEQSNDQAHDEVSSESVMQQQVRAKPVSSVAIAVGVGIGAGLLLSTIFSSERDRRERLARRMGSYLPSGQSLRSSIESILPDVITDRYMS